MILKVAQYILNANAHPEKLLEFLLRKGVCSLRQDIWMEGGTRVTYMVCAPCEDTVAEPSCYIR